MDNPVFESSQFGSIAKKPLLKRRRKKNPFESVGSGGYTKPMILEKRRKTFCNGYIYGSDSSQTMTPVGGYSTFSPSDKPRARMLPSWRKVLARRFRNEYVYGSGMDRKTCIWACDRDTWLDKSSGITWVGVHGSDSVCVVTRTGVLDIKRVCCGLKNYTIESFLHRFRETVIAEIEGLADPSSNFRPGISDPNPPNELRQSANKSIKKPFGIVSVGTDEVPKECDLETLINVYEERERERKPNRILEVLERLQGWSRVKKVMPCPSDEKNTIKHLQEKLESDPTFTINETDQAIEYDVKKTIKSLRKKMKSNVAFTTDETIQAAISAFQHLFGKKFKANEIGVSVFDPEHDEAKYKEYVKELEINDIEKHLAVINKPGSRCSSSSGHSTVASVELDENDK